MAETAAGLTWTAEISMTCAYCSHSFALTWGKYLAAPLGKHLCPACGRHSQFKLTLGYFLFVVAAWFVVAALAIQQNPSLVQSPAVAQANSNAANA